MRSSEDPIERYEPGDNSDSKKEENHEEAEVIVPQLRMPESSETRNFSMTIVEYEVESRRRTNSTHHMRSSAYGVFPG